MTVTECGHPYTSPASLPLPLSLSIDQYGHVALIQGVRKPWAILLPLLLHCCSFCPTAAVPSDSAELTCTCVSRYASCSRLGTDGGARMVTPPPRVRWALGPLPSASALAASAARERFRAQSCRLQRGMQGRRYCMRKIGKRCPAEERPVPALPGAPAQEWRLCVPEGGHELQHGLQLPLHLLLHPPAPLSSKRARAYHRHSERLRGSG